MDELDQNILDLLKLDGRASYTTLAQELDVSEGTIRNRIQQMQETGVIERFTVTVSESEQLSAIVLVEVDPSKEIGQILEEFPENITLSEVTGDWDVVAWFSRPDSHSLNETLEAIRKVEGVAHTKTYTVLASHHR